MKKISSFIVVVLVAFIACEKRGKPHMIPDEIKEYTLFSEGSFWVYEEVDSNAIDTMKVVSSHHEIHGSTQVPYDIEVIILLIRSSFFEDTISGKMTGIEVGEADEIYGYTERYLSYIAVTNLQFLSNMEPRDTFHYNQNISYTYQAFYDFYQVNGKEYKDVKEFHVNQISEPRLPKKVWYAKNVGVIRKELFNEQVWELQEYHINEWIQ